MQLITLATYLSAIGLVFGVPITPEPSTNTTQDTGCGVGCGTTGYGCYEDNGCIVCGYLWSGNDCTGSSRGVTFPINAGEFALEDDVWSIEVGGNFKTEGCDGVHASMGFHGSSGGFLWREWQTDVPKSLCFRFGNQRIEAYAGKVQTQPYTGSG